MTNNLSWVKFFASIWTCKLVKKHCGRRHSKQLMKNAVRLGGLLVCGLSTCSAEAQTIYGAAANGDWSNPLTWTPGGGPPGALDIAKIGTPSPAGSLLSATVTLTAAATVGSVDLGHVSGHIGTLNLNGNTLNVLNTLDIGNGLLATGIVQHNGGSLNLNLLRVRYISSFTYGSSDTSNFLQVLNGGQATTSASANISQSVDVFDQNSTMNLGAHLTLSQDLDIRGTGVNMATVNANGFDITARDIYIGRFGQHAQIINRGTITATRDLESSGSSFSLNSADSVANQVRATSGGMLTLHANTAAQSGGVSGGGTLNTAATSNLATFLNVFNQSSTAKLGADLSLTQDLDIRGTGSNMATVNANGFDITARDIYVGRFGQHAQIINRGTITATRDLESSGSSFSLNSADSVANQVRATSGGTLTLHANTAAQSGGVSGGGVLNTAATGNLATFLNVFDQNSTVNLGANLSLTQDLDIRGTGSNMATVNANGLDITARDIYVGRFGQHAQIINRGTITATRDLESSGSSFSLNSADSVANQVRATSGGTLTLHANTAAQSGGVSDGGTLNTAATSNLATFLNVFHQNSTANLGADLSLTQDLDIRGTGSNMATVNANGFDITARDIYVGRFGQHAQIINRGTITAARDLESSGSSFSLNSVDSVANQVRATSGGTLTLHANTAAQSGGVSGGGVLNTAATGNLATFLNVFDQNSTANLGADLSLTQDLDIRGTGSNMATVNANGFDITARDIYVGRFGQHAQILNRGTITATRDLESSGSSFSLNSVDSVANQVRATSGGTLTLHANTAAQSGGVFGGGTLNTAASNNLATFLNVFDQNSLVNLGGDLTLSQNIDVRGTNLNTATLNANGFDITANQLFVGRFNHRGSLINDGAVTVNQLLLDRSISSLTGGNDIVHSTLGLANNSTLTVLQSLGEMDGLTLNGNSLSIDASSLMVLDFDALINVGDDWAFRWLNPLGGDRIAALTGLIGAGRILINAPSATSIFDGGDGYTYIGYTTVPEPSAMILSFAALAFGTRRRSRAHSTAR